MRNPIYYFYKQVTQNADGGAGNAGDKHYQCYHGSKKIITITKSMKSNLTSCVILSCFNKYFVSLILYLALKSNLTTCAPLMYRLFTLLSERSKSESITQEEIDYASGKKIRAQNLYLIVLNLRHLKIYRLPFRSSLRLLW
jgi:hypothetical protein